MTEITRRNFLTSLGAGFVALPGVKFADKWVSSVIPFAEAKYSDWLHYATTCRECPAGCGMVLRNRQGRALKAEGNALQPVGLGRLCARGQSVVQGHYDPDRLKMATNKGPDGVSSPLSYQQALAEIGSRLSDGDHRVILISQLETGALAEIMENFCAAMTGSSRVVFFEAVNYTYLAGACEELFGAHVVPHFNMEQCDFILSLGAEFLGTWISPVEFARQFSRAHNVSEDHAMAHFVFAGPTLTQTAANADSFLQITPLQLRALAIALVGIVIEHGLAKRDPGRLLPALAHINMQEMERNSGVEPARLRTLADRFVAARSAIALPPEDRQTALAVMMLNYLNGNIGDTVDIAQPHALGKVIDYDELGLLGQSFNKGDVIIIHNANPVFALHKNFPLERAGLVVYMGTMGDETAQTADYVLPVHSPLESWGEYAPYEGMRSIMQPATAQLYPHGTMAAGDVLIALAKASGKTLKRGTLAPADVKAWLQESWRDIHQRTNDGVSFDDFFQRALARGGSWQPAGQPVAKQQKAVILSTPLTKFTNMDAGLFSSELSLWVLPHIMLFDGKTANRGWLQEAPEPISSVVWGNYAEMHPSTAAKVGVRQQGIVKITTDSGELDVAVRISADTAPGTITITTGFGHQAFGANANGVGVNALILGNIGFRAARVENVPNKREKLVFTSASDDQRGRDLLQWTDLAEIQKKGQAATELILPLPAGYDPKTDIFTPHPHKQYRWVMAIDLQRCIGCGSCAVACYAENSIPVKGKKAVSKGLEMAWLKIPVYRMEKDLSRVGFLPLPCQHCDSAPCESVCPVFAAIHNEEGLNAQVYNRCIGTRYCSNNCPYKVRRFNWSDNKIEKPLDQQLNPTVTARQRGVMEKCTFCIQRIRDGQQRARLQGRKLKDGEVQPACVQTCPTGALVFGNLLDLESRVRDIFLHDPRRYQLLGELNTKPAVVYLKRIGSGRDRI